MAKSADENFPQRRLGSIRPRLPMREAVSEQGNPSCDIDAAARIEAVSYRAVANAIKWSGSERTQACGTAKGSGPDSERVEVGRRRPCQDHALID